MKHNRIIAKMVSLVLVAECLTLTGCIEIKEPTSYKYIVIDHGGERVLHGTSPNSKAFDNKGFFGEELDEGPCYTDCCGTIEKLDKEDVVVYNSKPIEASYDSVCPNFERKLNQRQNELTK